MADGLEKRLTIDDRDYNLVIGKNRGLIDFSLIRRERNKAVLSDHDMLFADELGGEANALDEYFDDNDDDANALKVFRVVADEVIKWANKNKPYMMMFYASNKRRLAIYDWFVKKHMNRLIDYEYYYVENTFYFFKKSKNNYGICANLCLHLSF